MSAGMVWIDGMAGVTGVLVLHMAQARNLDLGAQQGWAGSRTAP
jgi:hypothetical protein